MKIFWSYASLDTADRSPAEKLFLRVMAAGYPWGRGSVAEAANLWHHPPILMLTRATRFAKWRSSGESRGRETGGGREDLPVLR